jgi:hypothetical protein
MMAQDPDPTTGLYSSHNTAPGFEVPGFWHAYDPLSFSAAGGTVPAFNGGFCYPAPLQMTSPMTDEFTSVAVDRNQDFAFSWTGEGAGEMNLVSSDITATQSHYVSCSYPAEAQTGVVPKGVLMQLSAGLQAMRTYHVVRRVVTAGDTCVALSAAMANLNSAGTENSLGPGAMFK